MAAEIRKCCSYRLWTGPDGGFSASRTRSILDDEGVKPPREVRRELVQGILPDIGDAGMEQTPLEASIRGARRLITRAHGIRLQRCSQWTGHNQPKAWPTGTHVMKAGRD